MNQKKYLCLAILTTLLVSLALPIAEVSASIEDVVAPSGTVDVYQTFTLELTFGATLTGSASREAVISSNIPSGWTYLGYEASLGGVPITFIEDVGVSVSWTNETLGEGVLVLITRFQAPFSTGPYEFAGMYGYRAGDIALAPWSLMANVVEFPSDATVLAVPGGVILTPVEETVRLSFEANLTGLACSANVSSTIPSGWSYVGYEAYVNGTSTTFDETVLADIVILENNSLGWTWTMNLQIDILLSAPPMHGDYPVTGDYNFTGGSVTSSGSWSATLSVWMLDIDSLVVPDVAYSAMLPIEFDVINPGDPRTSITVNVTIVFEGTLKFSLIEVKDFPSGTTPEVFEWDTLDLPSEHKDGGNVTVIVRLTTSGGELLDEESADSDILPATRDALWDRVVDIILEWPTASTGEREELWDDLVTIVLLWPIIS
jgi:hypothetical protein